MKRIPSIKKFDGWVNPSNFLKQKTVGGCCQHGCDTERGLSIHLTRQYIAQCHPVTYAARCHARYNDTNPLGRWARQNNRSDGEAMRIARPSIQSKSQKYFEIRGHHSRGNVFWRWDTHLNCKPSLYTKEMSGYPNPDIRKYRYTPRVGPQNVHCSVLVCFLQNTTILTRWPPEFSRTAAACGRFSCPAAKANHIASARCKAPRAPFSTSLHWDRGTEKPNVVIFGDCWAGFLQHLSDLKALGLSN